MNSSDSHITPIETVPDGALLDRHTGTIDGSAGLVGKEHIHKEEIG
jgi:hypothetical protein